MSKKIYADFYEQLGLHDDHGYGSINPSTAQTGLTRADKITEFIGPSQSDVILDVGCSYGYISSFLAKKAKFVVGVDISKTMLKRFKKRMESLNIKNVDGILCDVENLCFKDSSFDGIVAAAILEHVCDPYSVVEESKRVLKENGRAVFDVPNLMTFISIYRNLGLKQPSAPLERPHHIVGFDFQFLCEMLKRGGFNVTSAAGCGFYIPLLSRIGKYRYLQGFVLKLQEIFMKAFPAFSEHIVVKANPKRDLAGIKKEFKIKIPNEPDDRVWSEMTDVLESNYITHMDIARAMESAGMDLKSLEEEIMDTEIKTGNMIKTLLIIAHRKEKLDETLRKLVR